MILSLYFIIIVSAALLVQSLHSARRNHIRIMKNPLEGYQRDAFPQSKDNSKHRIDTPGVRDIENILNRLLEEVVSPKGQKREIKKKKKVHLKKRQKIHKSDSKKIRKRIDSPEKEPLWGQWTPWAPCSKSCGKGRMIRWRHCRRDCSGIETEMEEKSCQLPACESKLFGLIKL